MLKDSENDSAFLSKLQELISEQEPNQDNKTEEARDKPVKICSPDLCYEFNSLTRDIITLLHEEHPSVHIAVSASPEKIRDELRKYLDYRLCFNVDYFIGGDLGEEYLSHKAEVVGALEKALYGLSLIHI